MEKAKKGDRVEFMLKNKKAYGVVEKGGAKNLTVILDGAEEKITGHVSFFTLSDHPIPKDEPNMMDKYSIKGFKNGGINTDGHMFSCTILEDGVPIAYVSQGGEGGPNNYTPKKPFTWDEIKTFMAEAKAWCELFGYKDPIEPEDSWVDWWLNDRPYGKLGEKYFESLRKI